MMLHDRKIGAYVGAATGDAMGGPVECSHYRRIQRLVGGITDLLPYRKPYTFNDPKPGYCLRPDAGAVTDDTFIRGDLTRFLLQTSPPRTPAMLADWLLQNADFSMWWPPAIEALRRVERGEVTAEDGGLTFPQGSGLGWWTPIGILYATDPQQAAIETKSLCRIWKAPLEQDLLAATQAGVAASIAADASVESILEAMLQPCGPLARQILERAIELARRAQTFEQLAQSLYDQMLMPDLHLREVQEPPRTADAPLPPNVPPLADSDDKYIGSYFAEQVPLAVAAFVYADGDAQTAIPQAAMLGRDADTIATTVGAWVGGLHGESGLPRAWVQRVYEVNRQEIDLLALAQQLANLSG